MAVTSDMKQANLDLPDLHGATILQVVPELDVGGAETTTLEIATGICRAGGRALVASQGGRLESELTKIGAEIFHLPVASKNPFTVYGNIGRLAKLIKSEKVNIIHARSRAPAWSSLFAARRSNIAYMATYHSLVHDRPRLKVFYNSALTRGVCVIANSQFTADRIAHVHGVAAEKIKVVPRGCDADALARAAQPADARAQFRARWCLAEDDFVIICPARLTALKGQDVLVQAVGAVQEGAPQGGRVKLVFAGSAQGRDGYVAELEKLIAANRLESDVIFAGLVRNMAEAYAGSDLAVIASTRTEPFGRTAIEAQAASLPVIASDAGGYRENVKAVANAADGSGWLVEPGNVRALTQAIEAALSLSAQDYQRMGENGRTNVAARFTQAAMVANTLNVYRDILGSGC